MISWVWHKFNLLRKGSFPLTPAARVLALGFIQPYGQLAQGTGLAVGSPFVGASVIFSARSVPRFSSSQGCTSTNASVRKRGTNKGLGRRRKTKTALLSSSAGLCPITVMVQLRCLSLQRTLRCKGNVFKRLLSTDSSGKCWKLSILRSWSSSYTKI